MNRDLSCFLFGMAGNASIEVVRILNYAHRGRYHKKYATWSFWIARVILVLLSGVMALAYALSGFPYELLAFHVGAAATLIVEYLSGKLPLIPEPPSEG